MAGPHPQFTGLEGAAFQTQALFLINARKQRMLPCPPVYGFEKPRGKTEALGLLLDGFTSGGGFRQVDDINGKLSGHNGLKFIVVDNWQWPVQALVAGFQWRCMLLGLGRFGNAKALPCSFVEFSAMHLGVFRGIGLSFLISCRKSTFFNEPPEKKGRIQR